MGLWSIFLPPCRSAAREGLSADALIQELKSSLEWGEGPLSVVRHVWKEEGPALCSLPKEALVVGQVGHCNAYYIYSIV